MAAQTQLLAKWNNIGRQEAGIQAQMLGERLRDDLGIMGGKVYVDTYEYNQPEYHGVDIAIPLGDNDREIRVRIVTDNGPDNPQDTLTPRQLEVDLYGDKNMEFFGWSWIYDLDGDMPYDEIFKHAKAALEQVPMEDTHLHPKVKEEVKPLAKWENLDIKEADTQAQLLGERLRDELGITGMKVFTDHQDIRDFHRIVVTIPTRENHREIRLNIDTDHTPPLPYEHDKFTIQQVNIGLYDDRRVEPLVSSNIYDLDGEVDVDEGRPYNEIFTRAKAALDEVPTQDYYHHPKRWSFTTPPPHAIVNYDGIPENDFNTRKSLLLDIYQAITDTLRQRGDLSFKEENVRREVFSGALLVNIPLEDEAREFSFTLHAPISSTFSAVAEVSDPRHFEPLVERFQVYPSSLRTFEDFQAHLPEHIEDIRQLVNSTISMNRVNNTLKVYDRFIPLDPNDYHFPKRLNFIDEGAVSNRIYENELQKGLFNGEVNMISTPKEDYIVYAMIGEVPEAKWQFFRETILKDPNSPKIGDRGFEEEFSSIDDLKEAFRKDGIEFVSSESKVVVDNGVIDMTQTTDPVFVERLSALEKIASTVKEGLANNMGIEVYDDEIEIRLQEDNTADIYMSIGDNKTLDIRLDMEGREGNVLSHAVATISSTSQSEDASDGIDYYVGPTKEPLEDYGGRIYELASTSIRTMRQRELLDKYADDIPLDTLAPNAPKLVNIMGATNENNAVDEDEFEARLLNGEILRAQVNHTDLSFEGEMLIYAEPRDGNIQNMRFNRMGIYYAPQEGHGYATGITDHYNSIEELKEALHSEGIEFAPKAVLEKRNEQAIVRGSDYYEGFNAGHFNGKYVGDDQVKALREEQKKFVNFHPYGYASEDIETLNRIFPVKLSDQEDGVHLEASVMGHATLTDDVEISVRDQFWNDLFRMVDVVDGNLTLTSTNVESLGNIHKITGDLNANDSQLHDLGQLREVGGSLSLDNSNVESFGHLEQVGYNTPNDRYLYIGWCPAPMEERLALMRGLNIQEAVDYGAANAPYTEEYGLKYIQDHIEQHDQDLDELYTLTQTKPNREDWDDDDRKLERDVEVMKKALANVLSRENRERYTKYYVGNDSYLNAIVGVVDRRVNGGNSNVHITPSSNESVVSYVFDVRDVPAFGGALYLDFEKNSHYGSSPSAYSMIREVGITLENNNPDLLPKIGAQIKETYSIAEDEEFSSDTLVSKVLSVVDQYQTALREQEKSLEVEQKTNNVMPSTDSLNTSNSHRIVDVDSPENTLKGLDYDKIMDAINSEPKNLVAFRVAGDDDLNDLSKRGYEFYGDMVYNVVLNLPEVRDNVTTYRFEDGRTLDHLFITAEQMEKVMQGLAYSVSSDEGLVVTDSPRQNPTSQPRVRIQSQDEIFLDDITDVSTLEEVHDIIDRQVKEALAKDLAPWKDAHLETWVATNVNNLAQVEEQSQQVAIQLPLVGAKITINSSIEDLPETSLIVKSMEYNEQSDVYVIKSESGRDDIYMKPDTLRSILENGQTKEQIDEDFYITYSYSPPLAREQQQTAEVQETQATTQQETQQHVSQRGNAPTNRHMNESEYIERVVSGETLYLRHPLDLDDDEFANILHVDPDKKDADLLTLINRKGERLTVEKLDLLESLFDSSDYRTSLEFDFSSDMVEKIASVNRELSEQYKGYTYQTVDTSAIRVDEFSTYLNNDKLLVAVSDGERTYEDIPFNEFFTSLSQEREVKDAPVHKERKKDILAEEELSAVREFFHNKPRVGLIPTHPEDLSRYIGYTEVLITDVQPSATYEKGVYSLMGYRNGTRPESAYATVEMTGSQLRKMMAGSKTINVHDEVPTHLKVIFNSHLQDENLIKNCPSRELQDGSLQFYDISAYSSKSPLVRVVDPQLKTEHVERWDEHKLANAMRSGSLRPLYIGDLQNLVYNTYGGEGVDFSLTRKFNARGVDWNNLSQENLEASLPLNFKAAMEKVVGDLSNNQADFPELYGRVSAPTYSHNVYDNGINEIVVGIDVNRQDASEDAVIAHLDLSFITTPSANLKEDNAQLVLSFEGGPYKQSQVESVGVEKPSSLAIDPLKGYNASLKDIASFVRNCDLDLEEQKADHERATNNLKDFKNTLMGSTIGVYYDDSNKFVEYNALSIEDKGENLLLNLGLKDNNSPQLSIPIEKGLAEIVGKSIPDYWETTLEGSSQKIHIVPTQEYRDRFLLYSMIDKPLVELRSGEDIMIRELVPPQQNEDGSMPRVPMVKYIEDGWHENNASSHEVADWIRQGVWKEEWLPLPLRQYADHLWSDANTIKLIEKEDSYELYDKDASIANVRLGIPLRQVTMRGQNGVDEAVTVGSISKEKFNAYAHALRLEGTSLQIVDKEHKHVNTLSSVVNEDEIRQSSFAIIEHIRENIADHIEPLNYIGAEHTTRSDGSITHRSEMEADMMRIRVTDDYTKVGENMYLHTAGKVELFDMRKQTNTDIVNWLGDQEVKHFELNKDDVLSFVQNTYKDWQKQTKYDVSDNGYLNSIIAIVDRRINGGNSEVYLGTNSNHDTEFILESPKLGNPLYIGFDFHDNGNIRRATFSLDVTDRDLIPTTGTPIIERTHVFPQKDFSISEFLDTAESVVNKYQTAVESKQNLLSQQREFYKDELAQVEDFNKKGEYQLERAEFEAALMSGDVYRLYTPDDKEMYFYSKNLEADEHDYYLRDGGSLSARHFEDEESLEKHLEDRGLTFGDGQKVSVSSGVHEEQEENTLKNLSDPEEIAKKLYDSLHGSTVGSTFRNAFREQSYYEGVVSGYESDANSVSLYIEKGSPIDLTIEEAKKILEDNPSQVELSMAKSSHRALILSSDVMDQYLIGKYVNKPLIPANAEGPWAGKEYTIQKYIPLKGGTIKEMDTQTSAKQTKEIFGEFETSLAKALRNEELIVKQRNLPLELEAYRANIKDYPLNTVVFVEDENNRGMFVAFDDDVEKAKTILSKLPIASVENSEAFETKPNLVLPFMNAEEAAKVLVPYFKEAQQPLLVLSPTGYGPTHVIHLPAVPNGQRQELNTVDKEDREFTSVNFKGKEYECRVAYDNVGNELLIAGEELRNALGDFDKLKDIEASDVDDKIFYYANDKMVFESSNEELYKFLRDEHPDIFGSVQVKETEEVDYEFNEAIEATKDNQAKYRVDDTPKNEDNAQNTSSNEVADKADYAAMGQAIADKMNDNEYDPEPYIYLGNSFPIIYGAEETRIPPLTAVALATYSDFRNFPTNVFIEANENIIPKKRVGYHESPLKVNVYDENNNLKPVSLYNISSVDWSSDKETYRQLVDKYYTREMQVVEDWSNFSNVYKGQVNTVIENLNLDPNVVDYSVDENTYAQLSSSIRQQYLSDGISATLSNEEKIYNNLVDDIVASAVALKLHNTARAHDVPNMIELLSNPEIVERLEKDVNPVFDLISRALDGEKIGVEKFKAMDEEEQREESAPVEEESEEVLAEEKPRCHDRNIPEYNVGGDLNLDAKALAIDLAFCATYDNPIALTDKFTELYGGVRSLLYYNGRHPEAFTFTYDTPHGEEFLCKATIPEFLKELNTLGFKFDKEAFVLPETFTEMGKMRTLAPPVARAGLEEVKVALEGQNLAWKDLNGDGDIDANEVRVLDVSLSTDEKKYVLRVEDVNNKEVSGDISIDTAPLLARVRQQSLTPQVEEEKVLTPEEEEVLTPEEEEVIALKQYHTQAAEVIATRLENTDDADGYFINKNESSVRRETFLYPSMKSNLLPFSSLVLALSSENKNRQTNGYLFFTSAQYNKAHVLAEEKGTIVTVENKGGSRRRATLFNLDQTALQSNDEVQYNKIISEGKSNATDGLKSSVMLEAFKEMGVKLRQSADTDIYYDVKRDIIHYGPKPEDFTSQDKENLLYALVSATGAPSRLGREGLQKNASNDEKRYEELVGVLTVARIAEGERQPMRLPVAFPKDYWVEELRANPEIVERLEKDVNAAHNMVQSILSHRGIELNAQVTEDPTKRFFISDQVKALVDKESQRIVVIADKYTKKTDVIVPAGASPNTDGKKEGFDKALIESALTSAEGKYQVQRFYNKQGMYAFNQEDTYFINKEVSLFIQDKGEVTKAATLNIDDAIKNARNAVLEKVQMVRSEDHAEDHTWDMFIKPADGESFLIRPSKKDTHEFFNALHDNKDFENVRLNLGLKYFGIAQSAPEEKKALLEVDITGMDLNLIKGVREFKAKSGDIYARVTIEGVDSLKPRKVTPEQWQRLYLADDKNEYRKFLAAKLFGDVLKAQTEKVAEEKTKAQQSDEAMKVINRIDDIQKDYPNTYVAFRNKEDGGYDMYQDREKGYVKMFGVDEISDKYVNRNNVPLMLNHANDLQLTSVQEGPLGSRDVILTDLEKEGARNERFYSPDSVWLNLKAQPHAKDKVFIIASSNRAITYAEDAVKMNELLNRETEDYITHFVSKEKGIEDSYDYLIITKKDGSRFIDEDVNYLHCENRKLDDLTVEMFDYGKYYRAVVEKENENIDKLFTNSLYYKSLDKAVDINRAGFYATETIYTWQNGDDNYALRINGVQGEGDYLHLAPSLHGKVDDIVIHPTTGNPLFQNVGMRPLSVSIAKNIRILEFSNVKVTPIENPVRKQLVETPEIDKWLKAHPTINVTTSLPKAYDDIRDRHPEALILFRQTGGYVAFGRDAEEVAKVTGFEPVTINERSKREEVKLASFFGSDALDEILPKLIRKGNRIAIKEWPNEPSVVHGQQDEEMRNLKSPFNNPVEEGPSRSSGLHR